MATNLVLDTTLAGTNANSYIDQDFADSYWSGHYSSTKAALWAGMSDDQKTTLLISSTRIIDTARYTNLLPYSEYMMHYDYRSHKIMDITQTMEPCKYYYYQKLQFPRNLDLDPTTGALFIPIQVQMAVCEQAIYLLSFDESVLSARLQGLGSDTLSVGKGQLHTSQTYTTSGTTFAPMAMELVRPYFVSGSKMRRC